MNPHQLFRSAVFKNQHAKWLGDVVLVRPVSFAMLTAGAAICALVLVLFFVFGSYTKRITVVGQIVPEGGLIKIHSLQRGIVMKKYVTEGQTVTEGQVLFVLSSERRSSGAGQTQSLISEKIIENQESLKDELSKTEILQRELRSSTRRQMEALENELQKIGAQISGQARRLTLAEEDLERTRQLLSMNYISKDQVAKKQAEVLEQTSRLQALERDRMAISRELSVRRDELISSPLKDANQAKQLMRAIANTDLELAENEAKRSTVITAPENGKVTAVAVEKGYIVEPDRSMLSLVPEHAQLMAELFIPSRAIGFVKVGAPVLLRYQAFPYQKFGHGKGIVQSISASALPMGELSLLGMASDVTEPMYKVTVKLASSTVQAYGQPQPLRPGMQLEADIMQDSRRIFEWVLEPLYSISAKL